MGVFCTRMRRRGSSSVRHGGWGLVQIRSLTTQQTTNPFLYLKMGSTTVLENFKCKFIPNDFDPEPVQRVNTLFQCL